jgi:hypothetical protein
MRKGRRFPSLPNGCSTVSSSGRRRGCSAVRSSTETKRAARWVRGADSRAEAVRRAEDLILRDLIVVLTETAGSERLPAGTTVGVEGVELEPALRHIGVDAGPWPELGGRLSALTGSRGDTPTITLYDN